MRRLTERDIQLEMRTKGMEKGTIDCLVAIGEHIQVMHEQMNELTGTVNRLIDMMGNIAGGYVDLRKQVERVRNMDQDDDLPHKTE